VEEFTKANYKSHANEKGNCENMKMLLNCFTCYKYSDWHKRLFIISLYIAIHMWPKGPGGSLS